MSAMNRSLHRLVTELAIRLLSLIRVAWIRPTGKGIFQLESRSQTVLD